ncbi:hypothetical protein COV19_02895 [Candidatus Woesearchaeota archaeon CG10_big_fil_rev_8_21_14_0_10_44_13]|nr:MAG: hypothetical protein COV19_02895 [Candidatus Woesearchaeota archaeon CG10_big_fil_rev_8_21_14_0_10_44_13]
MKNLKSKTLMLVFLLILSSFLFSACNPNKLVISGDKSEMNLDITEMQPYSITISNQRGTTKENPSFSNIDIKIEGNTDLVDLNNKTIDGNNLAGGNSTKATFNIVGKKAGSGTISFYAESIEGKSEPTSLKISVTKPSLDISFGNFFGGLNPGKKESREVKLTNNDKRLYQFGKVRITSNHPNWVKIEPGEGYKAEQQGGVLELNKALDIENRIPFYITATPDANTATFTLILSVLYSHDGSTYIEISQNTKEMSVS